MFLVAGAWFRQVYDKLKEKPKLIYILRGTKKMKKTFEKIKDELNKTNKELENCNKQAIKDTKNLSLSFNKKVLYLYDSLEMFRYQFYFWIRDIFFKLGLW